MPEALHAPARRSLPPGTGAPHEKDLNLADHNRLVVVGIGASAGGVEALETFFRAVPDDLEAAFAVVTHMAKGQDSSLPEIIGRRTTMPVVPAEDGMTVESRRVHVMPPDTVMTVEDGRLRLRPLDGVERERGPIDLFFASLAEERGDYAVAVVLSGTGSDGALGVKSIKEAGGLTLAQGVDSTRPRYEGMPHSAIATGLIDIVVPAQDMAGRLGEYVRSFALLGPRGRGGNDGAAPPSADPRRNRLRDARPTVNELLRNHVGHDFSGYKESTFLRRIQRHMQVVGLHDLDAYLDLLRREPREVGRLFRDLLIGVTAFFRDQTGFEVLEREVIPRLFEGRGASDTVRVWVPACSTGEEVYSIAILLRERMDALDAAPKVQLFATDIDDAALAVARAARYPAGFLKGVDPERVRRFFTEDGGVFALNKVVRDLCIFSTHSVVRDPPFSRIDLISCRNLLIYLEGTAQSRVVPMFHYALRPGGFLFLGTAENVTQHGELFEAIDKKNRVFRRRDRANAHLDLAMLVPHGLIDARGPPPSPAPKARGAGAGPRWSIEARVLERFGPAYVVVDGGGDVVHYSPRTGRYLEAPAGAPSRELLAMARRGLQLDLRAALKEAAGGPGRRAVRRNVAFDGDAGLQGVDLTVEPLPRQGGDRFFLVVFADAGPAHAQVEDVRQVRARSVDPDAVELLEGELSDLRDRLRATIERYEASTEELRAANEELVSVNEEFQSTNEELETSKEELQSVNEELHTVNAELGRKVDELDRTHNDLANLFVSTRIATVFLDRNLLIRDFTPAFTEITNLRPGDRGRPLADIVTYLDYPDLERDARRVLEAREPLEIQLGRRDARTRYQTRLMPYRVAGGSVDGVVITLVDVTAVAEAEERQRTLAMELDHRVKNMLAVVTAVASQTLRRSPSPEAFAADFLGRLRSMAGAYALLTRGGWGDVPLRKLLHAELDAYADDRAKAVTLRGPHVLLKPKAALALGMTVHELATNALKHGALSAPDGRVAVVWRAEGTTPDGRLVLDWRETGGPAPNPSRRGYGTVLIERELSYELGGEAVIDFAPGGVRAALAFPLNPDLVTATSETEESADDGQADEPEDTRRRG